MIEVARTMPVQKPGRSKQDYGTPRELINAVEARFGKLVFDLAASAENAKAPLYFTEEDDALKQSWAFARTLCWLNPPFADIAPWAEKCKLEAEQGARIMLLTPASVGANWFAEHVHGHALVLALSPRLTFEGMTQPYPKDCVLSCYGFGVGFDTWRWK